MDYRFKHTVEVVKFPKGFEEEDRGYKSCCCESLVLAHPTDTESWKNDITGVFLKKGNQADIVNFEVEKCGDGVLPLLGEAATFPNDPLAVGFMVDWQQYLIAHGAGKYKVKIAFTISGITSTIDWGVYTLKAFNTTSAKGTVRIRSLFDSYFLPEQVDFTSSNFQDTLRFNGFFGERKPGTEVNELITRSRRSVKTTRENLNTYELMTDPILECLTRRILDLHLLGQDLCYVSDHNRTNHSYQYLDREVVLDAEPEVEYIRRSRYAKITAKFADRTKDQKSYYNRTT